MQPGRRGVLATLAGGAAFLATGMARGAPLAKVIEIGTLNVAVYRDFEPWAWRKDGKLVGIDVEIAELLASAIALKVDYMELTADDNVGADLRNAVWRGSVVGTPPADILMHVPVDRQLALANDRAVILGAYCREGFGMVCNREVNCEGPPVELKGHPLAAELDSVPDFYLLGSFGGALRNDVHHQKTGTAAVAAVADGSADAAVATRAQIEHGMAAAPGKLAERKAGLPMMTSPGWNVGMAVKDNSRDLGDKLDAIVTALIANGKIPAIFERYNATWRPPVEV